MKKVLMLLLLVCLVLPVAVYAGSPHEEVEGYFNYAPTGCDFEMFPSDNYIGRECHDDGVYGTLPDDPNEYGDFVGESSEVYELVLHGFQEFEEVPPYFPIFEKKGWYKGIVDFEGTVGESAWGTMRIKYIGKSLPGEFVWSGTWRILGGEDGLEGIHGGGTWEGSDDPNFMVHLEGKIHFSPE